MVSAMTWRKMTIAFFGLFLIMAGVANNVRASNNISNTDSDGPTIIPEMPQYIDVVGSGEKDTYWLVLRANVTDPDGIETVIGSYCNRSEGKWYNITMQPDPDHESGDIYKIVARNYTLTNRNSGVIWDIKFYACDSLGHWSTNQTFQSVNRLWRSEPTGLEPVELTIGITTALLVLAVVIIVIARRMGS